MSDKHPSQPGPEHDPYDPERKTTYRRPVGPRLADLSRPAPPPDPGPAVPRPYAPQKRIRDDAVVPPEDNPLVGWRWLGARLLSRNLWPRDALTNPMMVYYSGRKRGRLAEDLMGVMPWMLLLLADAFFFFQSTRTFDEVWLYGFASFYVLSLLAPIYGMIVVSFHVRRTINHLPVEEILLTRLRHVDIVQGLSIRPLAVQSAAITLNSFAHAALVIWAAVLIGHPLESPDVVGYVMTMALLRWYFFTVLVETGGALAMRCHLCLRSPLIATLRFLFDLIVNTVPVLIIATIVYAVLCCAGGLLVPFVIAAGEKFVGVILTVVVVAFVGEMLKSISVEAMDWCHHYPDEWWMASEPGDADVHQGERTLLTPWRPIPGRRRINVRRYLKMPPPDSGTKQ